MGIAPTRHDSLGFVALWLAWEARKRAGTLMSKRRPLVYR